MLSFLAEEEGFEPPVPRGTTVFKTAAFDHSATPLFMVFPETERKFSAKSNPCKCNAKLLIQINTLVLCHTLWKSNKVDSHYDVKSSRSTQD